MMRSRPVNTRAFGAVAFAGAAVFAGVTFVLQFLRSDLDWIKTPLSYYLNGAYGDLLIAAYVALSASLLALGIGFYRGSASSARSAAPLLLFVVGGVALAVTGLSEKAKAYGHPIEWEMVHLAATETTFLCVTVAMLLQSWWLRFSLSWRTHFAFAFGLAIVAFVALWMYALWHALPRGASQKIVIALIVWWLGWASALLRRK